jgi:FkbH-like protein
MTPATRAQPPALDWLPAVTDFDAAHARARDARTWEAVRDLSRHRLDFLQTGRLAKLLDKVEVPPQAPRLRLAVAGAMTFDHLVPALRIGALRRGLALEVYLPSNGQWRQELLSAGSGLLGWRSDCVLICQTERELLPSLPLEATRQAVDAAVSQSVDALVADWRLIRQRCGASVIQQLPLPQSPGLFGQFDALVPAAPRAVRQAVLHAITRAAADEGVLILDPCAAQTGLDAIHDRRLWLHAKQHVSPAAAPWFGDQVARMLAALRGLSRKVLVLDLDNTLWGGVLGDDGRDGIVIGEGSARGEAFSAFQTYIKALQDRGVILAVSSKNDLHRAEAAFDHPEMILRRQDFACFVADWNDKATGLQRIAQTLSLGLDSLVFFDDNPAERALVRQNLPQVAVHEVPPEPEDYVASLAHAGWFEAVAYTPDDAGRAQQYAQNAQRLELAQTAPDMDSFLRSLEMEMSVTPVRKVDLARVTQLINKTNQFNLMTRRRTQDEVQALLDDPATLSFCVRLSDRFGDNGIISVLLARIEAQGEARPCTITDWLMSCRVLGRRVEEAIISVLARTARDAGATQVRGCFRPTGRNDMVADLYSRLGFSPAGHDGDVSIWSLDPANPPEPPAPIRIQSELEPADLSV